MHYRQPRGAVMPDDNPGDAVFSAHEQGGFRPPGKVVPWDGPKVKQEPPPPLILHPAELPDPSTIKPREWLYGTQLIKGYVTVLVAPGGTGKSAYAMGAVLSLVTGKSLLGEHVFSQVRGAIFNLEDPMEELNRRIAALMIRYNINKLQVEGHLYLDDGEGRGLTIASFDEKDGYTIVHPDESALIKEITEKNIGVIVCDPFAESHTLEENSNPQMVKAAAAWRRVARATGCAVLLVHHVRKGDATGIDAARGAKALTDSARVGLLMCTMSVEDGKAFKIADDDRWQYVRLDDAKRNMAPAAKAKWFRLEQVELGNPTEDYPSGDKVAAIVPWEPPCITQTNADLNRALDVIRDGPELDVLYTATRRGNSSRWAGQVLCDLLDMPDKQAASLVTAWLKSGLLWEDEYEHPKWRRIIKGVRVNEAKRPSM